MNRFWFIYLTTCTVLNAMKCAKCDEISDSQGPDLEKKVFNVYWNVPSINCRKHSIQFDDLYEKYGIIQNNNDNFHGEKISILYHPGNFPGLVENSTVNGVVPQEGNLLNHLQKFKKDLEETIPDKNFQGVGIIDFENWSPILRQNFGTMEHIRVLTPVLERLAHWWWPKQWIDREAERRFESSARSFLQASLNLAKKLRPKAVWGYYGFPECFNRVYFGSEKCAREVRIDNDKLNWLWSTSTALFPSVYSFEAVTTPERLTKFISCRINEAARVKTKGTPILPYFWFRYKDGNYFKKDDLEAALSAFHNSNASGFIIWGSYKDVINKSLCLKLKEYTTNILGPAIANYTKPSLTNIENLSVRPNNVTKYEPIFKLSEADERFIEQIVSEEMRRQIKSKHHAKGSELVDVILEKIASYWMKNNWNNKHNISTESPTTTNSLNKTSVEMTTVTNSTTEDIITSETNNPIIAKL